MKTLKPFQAQGEVQQTGIILNNIRSFQNEIASDLNDLERRLKIYADRLHATVK